MNKKIEFSVIIYKTNMNFIYNMKQDLLLITNDTDEKNDGIITTMKYDIRMFSLISNIFDQHINCESFDRFCNKKDDGTIEYKVYTDYDTLNWVLYIYFDIKQDNKVSNNDMYSLLIKLDWLKFLKVYKFAYEMEINSIMNNVDKYLKESGYLKLIEFIIPKIKITEYCCWESNSSKYYNLSDDCSCTIHSKYKSTTNPRKHQFYAYKYEGTKVYKHTLDILEYIIKNLQYIGYFNDKIKSLICGIIINYSEYDEKNKNKDWLNKLLTIIKNNFNKDEYIYFIEYYTSIC